MLRDRVIVVTGGDSAIGRDLVEGLRQRGAQVAAAPGNMESRAEAVHAVEAALTTVGRPELDMLVHVPLHEEALLRAPLAAIDDLAWDARGEALVRAAIWACQAAHARMIDHGGRIVLVTATAGLVGAGDRVPLATAMEGIRSLAKVAARQWGKLGITLNCIAIAIDDAADGPLSPALGRTIDVRRDLAAAVEMLAGDAGGAITGATVPLDGGVVMTP